MTRAQGPGTEIDYRTTGTAGADRVVLVVRTGAVALTDPDPHATAARDVRLVLVQVDGPELDDPPAYGGETPAGSTAAAILDILRGEARPDAPVGLVGERGASAFACTLAADLDGRVDRLALVDAPLPPQPLQRDLLQEVLAAVPVTALLLDGAREDAASAWYASHLRDPLRETVAAPHDRVSLTHVWPRILAHVAPDTQRW